MELIGYGHSYIEIRLNDGTYPLFDPFINGSPLADISFTDSHPNYILITHGHSDHIGDMLAIARASKAMTIAMAEVAMYAQPQGVEAHGMNPDERYVSPFGSAKFVPALHSSGYGIGGVVTYMDEAGGTILKTEDKKIYHTGNTTLFPDMRPFAEDRSINAAFLPINDNYTMGPEDVLEAIAYLNPEITAPTRYNTFSVTQQGPAIFVEQVVGGRVLNPGETILIQEEITATKRDQISKHIEDLPIDDRISARGIAESLSVNEGIVYRAIKDAEDIELVSAIQRVGTIRIERKLKKHIEKLTFDGVVRTIEEDVLGGSPGLDKVLSKLVIGTITETAMTRYTTPGSLVIVGNRQDMQKLTLGNGATVLITGGFETPGEIVQLVGRPGMPVLRTTYDTLTVATMINRALSDQLIKKDILSVSDTYIAPEKANYLSTAQTIADYQALSENIHHSRFPVVNKKLCLVGIVTAKDIIGKGGHLTVDRAMTEDPNVVKKIMSVTSVSHQITQDGPEVTSVVEDDLALVGAVPHQDVTKAVQLVQRQP